MNLVRQERGDSDSVPIVIFTSKSTEFTKIPVFTNICSSGDEHMFIGHRTYVHDHKNGRLY